MDSGELGFTAIHGAYGDLDNGRFEDGICFANSSGYRATGYGKPGGVLLDLQRALVVLLANFVYYYFIKRKRRKTKGRFKSSDFNCNICLENTTENYRLAECSCEFCEEVISLEFYL